MPLTDATCKGARPKDKLYRRFQLCTAHHITSDPDGPVDGMLSGDNENPGVIWAFDLYRDDASFDRHYSNQALDEARQLALDLLATTPMRVAIHVVFAS